MNDLSPVTDAAITPYSDSALKYARKSKSDRTLKLYGAAWREFEHYAVQHGATALPATPRTVIEYLATLADAGAKVSTIGVSWPGLRTIIACSTSPILLPMKMCAGSWRAYGAIWALPPPRKRR